MREVGVRSRAIAVGLCAVAGVACARTVRNVEVTPARPAVTAELWQEPGESRRDLFHGPGGREHLPQSTAFTFIAEDTSGFSPGFDVRGDAGIEWSVKTGPEAQTEVVASRLLWAIGFHQPPTYYVEAWEMKGRAGVQEPARFRPDLPGREVVADWPWHENPFVGSREYGGLIVANLMLTSWDWKTSNNKIYELEDPVDGVSRWFVVRDLGASLGKFTYPTVLKWFRLRGFGQGTRNDLPGFEAQGFIERIDPETDRVHFDYRGIYRDVIATVTAPDVRWACDRFAELSDAEWDDAFRAGGYAPDQRARYIARIKAKIAQGLALTARGT
jgi:hypothetical protein